MPISRALRPVSWDRGRHIIAPIRLFRLPQVHDLDAAISCVVSGQAGQRKVLSQANLDEPMRGYVLRDQVPFDGACASLRERSVVISVAHAVRMALDCKFGGTKGVERKCFGQLGDLLLRSGRQPIGIKLKFDGLKRNALRDRT